MANLFAGRLSQTLDRCVVGGYLPSCSRHDEKPIHNVFPSRISRVGHFRADLAVRDPTFRRIAFHATMTVLSMAFALLVIGTIIDIID